MNILVLHPELSRLGGIESYFEKLSEHYSFPVTHFVSGKRKNEKGTIGRIKRLWSDYCQFVKILDTHNIGIVHVNPSLELKSCVRESLFILLARLKKKKVVTFFHGWDKSFAEKIERYFLWGFKAFYGASDAFIVLSEEFSASLKSWGFSQPIHIEYTIIDDESLRGFDIDEAIKSRCDSSFWRILFISRIFKEKGVFEAIEAFGILKEKYNKLELVVAGDGVDLEKAKAFARERAIPDVRFTGDIRGSEKDRVFRESHALCFPTYHNEGLPSNVVESMAFGLPVVTRPVGGLVDFFKNGENGFLSGEKDPEVFAGHLEKLITNQKLYKHIAYQNYAFAQQMFLASQAAARYEKIYGEMV